MCNKNSKQAKSENYEIAKCIKINQIKTDIKPSQATNIITFYNELNNEYDPIELNLNKRPNNEYSDLVFTIQNENIQTLSDKILEIYDNQIREKYYSKTWYLLHFFFAQKWLSKIRNKTSNKTQVYINDQLALSTKLSDNIAKKYHIHY